LFAVRTWRDDGAVAAFGRLDAVVNNAGRFGGGPVLELTDEALSEGLDTKVAAGLRVVRHALPHLRASDRAAVVNVSGITAEMVIPGAGVTAMGNAGLRRGIAHARWGAPEETADVVVFLLSRAARFVNGTVLRADGGQSPAVDY
jgi:NAD(P)-dependent dehydrogenase (short-subunit alcohol dehydrogenase family)